MARSRWASVGLLLGLLGLVGCAPAVSQMMTVPEDAPAQRQLQTRRYEAPDEGRVLEACTALLQDMGFQIEEGSSRLGLVLGSKMRDANTLTPEQRALAVVAAAGLLAGGYTAPLAFLLIDKIGDQPVKIEVAVFTRSLTPAGGPVEVRIIMRETEYKDGRPGLPAILKDATLYQEAFDRLSKALFLEVRDS